VDPPCGDEPPFAGPERVIARGRRTVRTRRITAGAGVAAVLAVAGALLVPGLIDDPRPGGSDGVDPAVQDALENYDAQAMPQLIERKSREVFSRRVADLGDGEFGAYDGNGAAIGPEHYDKASGMSISYGERESRELDVGVMHAGSEAEGDHEELCDSGIDEGYYLECSVDMLDNGDVLVTYVTALRPFMGDGWHAVFRDELETRNPERLWFQQHAEVIKSDTFLTTVEETVKAPSLADAKKAFLVPVEDLASLAADPSLVLPKPPPDEIGGCSQWILPGSRVSCEG
jgi:hypothetical protein